MMVINLRFVCQPQRGYTWPNEWSQCNKNVLWMNEGESVFFFSTSWWQLRTIFKKKTEKLINPAFFFLSLWFRWDDLKHQSTVRENNKRLKKKKEVWLFVRPWRQHKQIIVEHTDLLLFIGQQRNRGERDWSSRIGHPRVEVSERVQEAGWRKKNLVLFLVLVGGQ